MESIKISLLINISFKEGGEIVYEHYNEVTI